MSEQDKRAQLKCTLLRQSVVDRMRPQSMFHIIHIVRLLFMQEQNM